MDGQNYGDGYTFDLVLRFLGSLAALVATYIEPNPAVWLASGAAAFLVPAVGSDRSAVEIVRHIIIATLAGVFGSQVATYMTHIPAPSLAFFFAWIGPDLAGGIGVAARQGEFGPRALIAAVLDHLLGRGNKA